MNETVESPILAQFREVRGALTEMSGRIDTLQTGVHALTMKVDGIPVHMTTMAGFVRNHETRIEALGRREDA